MIKNLLYSLFLHLVLIAAIYVNFNLSYKEQDEPVEIVISMNIQTIQGPESESPASKDKTEEVVEEKKPEIKKPEKPKEKAAPKKKTKEVTTPPKKEDRSIKKETIPSAKKEFKDPEALDEKEVKKVEKVAKKVAEEEPAKDEITDAKTKPEKEVSKEVQSTPEPISNTIENLNLSAREKFNIQAQLRLCYRKAIEESKLTSKIKITVKASIDENGYITLTNDQITENEEVVTQAHKIAFNNAKRAVEICSPLRNLPLDKYYIWKEVLLQFDEEN